MYFAIFEGTYNVIITLRNIRITNSALGVPIDEPLGPFGPSGLSLAPLGRHSHALILVVIMIHYKNCTDLVL